MSLPGWVKEIQRLRDENANLDAAARMADQENEEFRAIARDTDELLAGIAFTNPDEAEIANKLRQQWQALIAKAEE